ncbi:MAG: hypothetical protein R3B54_09835 [Bdellovibrionota bacterium]
MKTAGLFVSIFVFALTLSPAFAGRDLKATSGKADRESLIKALEEIDRLAEKEKIRQAVIAERSFNFALERLKKTLEDQIKNEADATKKKDLAELRDTALKGLKSMQGFETYLAVDTYVHSGVAVVLGESAKKEMRLQLTIGRSFLLQYANDPAYYDGVLLSTFISLVDAKKKLKLTLNEQLYSVFQIQAKYYALAYDKKGPQSARVERIIKATKAGPNSKEFLALVARESLGKVHLKGYQGHADLWDKLEKLKAGDFKGSIVLVEKDQKESAEASLKRLKENIEKVDGGQDPAKFADEMFLDMANLITYAQSCESLLSLLKERSIKAGDADGFGVDDAQAIQDIFARIDKIEPLLSTETYKKLYTADVDAKELSASGQKVMDDFKKWLEDNPPGK